MTPHTPNTPNNPQPAAEDRRRGLESRRHFIGGSDARVIMGAAAPATASVELAQRVR